MVEVLVRMAQGWKLWYVFDRAHLDPPPGSQGVFSRLVTLQFEGLRDRRLIIPSHEESVRGIPYKVWRLTVAGAKAAEKARKGP